MNIKYIFIININNLGVIILNNKLLPNEKERQ